VRVLLDCSVMTHIDQQRLAEAAGVSHMCVWRLVSGRTRYRPRKWRVIKDAAERLGLTIPEPPTAPCQRRYPLPYADCVRVAAWARISVPAVLRALRTRARPRTRELVGDAIIALRLELQ
jgi:hypothetical protein